MSTFRIAITVKGRNGRLVEFLKETGWSQSQLGEACNASQNAVSSWVCLRSIPNGKSMALLCSLIGVEENILFPPEVRGKRFLRSRKDMTVVEEVELFVLGNMDALPALEAGDPVEIAERKSAIERAIDFLPPRYGEVLRLRFFEDMNLEEAGKELGVTRERIRQMEHKALRHLRHEKRGLGEWE